MFAAVRRYSRTDRNSLSYTRFRSIGHLYTLHRSTRILLDSDGITSTERVGRLRRLSLRNEIDTND